MSRFVTEVSDFLKEECHTAMLHGDMNISRLVVYEQSIKESKMTRVRKDLKRGRYEDQGQPRFKKRAPNQDFSSAPSSAPKVNHEGGGGSQISKPTCSTCGKKYFGKCLSGTSGCYGCGKYDHKGQNVRVRLPGTTLRIPEEDPNPWTSKHPRQLEVVIGGSGSASRTCFSNCQKVDPRRGPAPPMAKKWLRVAETPRTLLSRI
uniref:Gag-pol polyprotein n=2 Tax=Solanum TaxID=4107 RepID=M1DIL6_SOLTU